MHSGLRPVSLGLLAAIAVSQVSCAQKPVAGDPKTTASIPSLPANSPQSRPAPAASPVLEPVTDVDSAVRRAIDWHPAIREAAGRIREQGEIVNDAKSEYLPSVGGGVDLGVQNRDRGDWTPRFNLTASQMVYDFGKVSGRVDAESAVQDVRKAELLASVDDVIRDTALASVEVLRAGKLAGVAKDQIDDVQAIGRLVEARTDQGASTRSDKLQAQARVQTAESRAIEISAQKQRWASTLNALVGATAPVELRASMPDRVLGACAGTPPVWETVPAVVAAKSRKREADARVKLARAEMLPTLALEASGQFNVWDSSEDPDYVVGLTIKGDLYNGGSFRARQNAAKYAAESSEAAVAAALFDAQKSWNESSAQVLSLVALQKSLASRQPMMRQTRDLYQRQFLDLGTRTLLDVLNADQELHEARFDEINTRFDLYKLNIECAYAAGRLREVFNLAPSERARESAGAGKRANAVPG